jgi:plastocyanin domain-containing protein
MKGILIAIVVSAVLIGGAVVLSNSNGRAPVEQAVKENNVSIVDGVQIVEIDAKGGYLPRKSIAKAGVPTVIRFNTTATFDCSSSVRIPSMDISKLLPQTGSTDIDVGVQDVGPLEGSCGMGMYPFEVVFE